MSKTKRDGTNFLVQGSILAVASIISRIIGLVYRIPLNNILGDVGISYYACAFDVYNVVLIISSYSLPQAVSKTVSARAAKGQYKSVYQVLKGALLFAVIAGVAASLIIFFGAEFFTGTLLKTPYSVFALRILGPALIVVAVLGVIRGFFQGLGTMMPSAVSQIIEQIVNAIVSVWAAYVLYGYGTRIGAVLGDAEHYGPAYGAAGGTLGTNLGSVAALVFVLFVFFAYMHVFKRRMKRERGVKVDSFGYTMKVLVLTIIPVLLSTTVYNISGIIDQGIFKNVALLQGYTENKIDVWWGVFSGKYKLLINVPISIASAMAASSVPTLTMSFARKDMTQVRSQINSAMRFIMVISFPCAVGLAVLGEPICRLLFPGTVETAPMAGTMMWVGALAVVFYAMSTLSNGLLQGIDQLKIPVINAVIALVAHVILLVILMLFFRLNIYAVVIANMFFALLMCVLNARAVAKYSGYRQEYSKTFVIPALASAVMGVVTFFVYKGSYALIKMNAVAAILAILVAVIVYAVVLLVFKGLDESDILKFPKGELLVRIAKKLHLLK
jgi:stage V sporulation protein B